MTRSFDRDWTQLLRTALGKIVCLYPKEQSPSSSEVLLASHAGVLTPEGRLGWPVRSKKQGVGGW